MSEPAKKLAKLRALSDAIVRQKQSLRKTPGVKAALQLQHLEKQRESLLGTLPFKLVVTNE